MLEDPQNFLMPYFSNVFKKMSEMALLGPDKYQKKQSHEFWCLLSKICGNVGLIQVVWAIMAQPRVK